jgi:hypothetical protein
VGFLLGDKAMAFDGSPDNDFPVDSGRYIGVDDQVMVRAVSNTATQTITVRGRLCRKDGVLIPFTQVFTTGAAGAVLTKSFQLAEGFLESLHVHSPACATSGQWLYAALSLQRGTGADAFPYETLYAGYVGSVLSTGWPRAVLQRPTDGPGTIISVAVASPAPGAEWSVTVRAGVRWEILCASMVFTTSGTTVTRSPGVSISDGINVLYALFNNTAVLASAVIRINYSPGVPYFADYLANLIVSLPDATALPAGFTIGSLTRGMVSDDQYSSIFLTIRERAEMQ